MGFQNVEQAGDKLTFGGYPVEILVKHNEYYIKCKEVYISYTSFLLWKKNIKKDIVGYNKEGTPCKISRRDGFIRISCLRETSRNVRKLEFKLKKIIKCQQEQKVAVKQQIIDKKELK